jgi:hypothetical protein
MTVSGRTLAAALMTLALLPAPQAAHAFCGFYAAKGVYAAKADAQLFNQASQGSVSP